MHFGKYRASHLPISADATWTSDLAASSRGWTCTSASLCHNSPSTIGGVVADDVVWKAYSLREQTVGTCVYMGLDEPLRVLRE
jgi:hypothetical protein